VSDSPHTITMTFDLTDPDARMAFDSARQGLARGLVLWDLAQEMRSTVKYNAAPCWSNPQDDDHIAENRETVKTTQYWRDRLWDLMELHGVTEVE